MSRDLNPKIASYIQNNQKTKDVQFHNDVCEDLDSIRQGIGDNWISEKSLFEFENEDQTMSEGDFEKMIAAATGSNDYDSEARLLMRILDKDQNGSISKSEAKVIMRDKSEIDTFSLWDSLSSFTEESVNLEVSWKTDLEALENGEIDWGILQMLKGEEYVKKLKEKAANEGYKISASVDTAQIAKYLHSQGFQDANSIKYYTENFEPEQLDKINKELQSLIEKDNAEKTQNEEE